MTIDDHVNNYLRDAQYKIALLAVEMDTLDDDGSNQYENRYKARLELAMLMDILYEGNWLISEGYNHIQYVAAYNGNEETVWTERDIISEIQKLRYKHGLNEVAYINFTGHYPQLTQLVQTSGGSGSGLPSGIYNQMVVYNILNEQVAVDIDEYGGALPTESINSYFSGRV